MFKSHLKLWNVASLAVVILLCVVYIIQVNSAIAKGYEMREIETQIHELTLSNQKLEVVARQAQSLNQVTHAVKMLDLVKAEQPTYVQGSQPSYALAE